MADLCRCIGSAKFGIEAHDAPVEDFPVQPSQKDGLGRMCKTHWNQYTSALRKAALARKAADALVTDAEARVDRDSAPAKPRRTRTPKEAKPELIRTRAPRTPKAPVPTGGAPGDAG